MFKHRRALALLLTFAALAAETKSPRTDCYGDPLPDGAIARMGTVRGRLPGLVEVCAFSRDGKMLVAAGGDAKIHLFDAETGRPLRELCKHNGKVTCLSFSPGGKMLASGDTDGTICLWDWPSRKVLRQFQAYKGGVRFLEFADSGKLLISCGPDTLIHLWAPETGRELRPYKGHGGVVGALAVSPDGRRVASSSLSIYDTVQLWEAASGRLLHQHKSKAWFVRALVFSPDNKMVALPVDYTKIGLWDVASGKIVRQLVGKQIGGVSALAFSPDGRILASASPDCSLILWDISTGKILNQLPGKTPIRHPGGITCLAFSPDGCRLAYGEDHYLHLRDLGSWWEVYPVGAHANQIYRVLFSGDDKTLITAADSARDALQEWDSTTGKKQRILWRQGLIERYGFHLSPDHTELTIAAIEEKSLLIRSQNTASGKEICRSKLPFLHEGGYDPAMIVLSPDGKIIANLMRKNNGSMRSLLLRDSTTGKVLGEATGYLEPLFRFAPDGDTLAYIGEKAAHESEPINRITMHERIQINLYNVPRRRIAWKLPLARKDFYPLTLGFSPDSRLVAVGSTCADKSSTSRFDLWESIAGQKRAALPSSRATPNVLAFSPDSALLAVGDSESVIHLWSIAAGKEVRQLCGHRGAVESLAFSHDGKLLASGSWDTTALIWDIHATAEAARPHPTDVPRERLERLWADLAGDDDGRVHRAIWGLIAARQAVPWLREHVKPVPPADAQRISRLITDLESDSFAVREKATHELETMAESAEPALRKVLASKPTLELRRRAEPIVKNLDNWPASFPMALRDLRALEVLEHLGTPDARQLLQKLAEGVPEARLTREAKAALQRLAAR